MKTNNLTLPVFLEFVELKTKVASLFPMIIGFAWSQLYYQNLNLRNSLLFAIAVIAFDMCTTAINNTMDFIKAHDMTYQQEDNVIGKYGLHYKTMTHIIYALLIFSALVSLVLVVFTDILLLPIGALCFLIGISYTFGPFPLSRLPLGEIFSGITMGFGIFFLAIYVQDPHQLLYSQWDSHNVLISLNWLECLKIGLMSLPMVCLIANIMLANNLCDYDQDIRNQRFTLIHFIGKTYSIYLYAILHTIPWIMWLFFVVMGWLPITALILYLAYPISFKSLRRFLTKQEKRLTFIESIKSFVLFSSLYFLILLLINII
ncbi:UbiA family prenyltransferase [Streptococcus ictaluri]|uniref:Prenyltransferase, UbiA family n=1 Tax=Streptococcus ictaluri 707-05 TaxID=764299 RepID=G5K394_9STRE|nr:UbiA family prenyltransferase [Streptococcus ictaluri]EHI69545.1 prenyltransferase, UbiA family [Streptococcus ictaluri 707-05]